MNHPPQITCTCSAFQKSQWCEHMPPGAVKTGWNPREVLLQYPTYTIWKKAFEVTLDEAEKYPVLAERWGNSYEGYTINILKEGIII